MGSAAHETALLIEQPQYLTFEIADDEYAIGLLRVREILQYPRVTRVPQTPPWIRGVMNLRGSVVPVVDLSVKFGLGPSRVTRTTCVVVLEVELNAASTVMAIVTDRVSKVIELAESEIEPPPAFGTRVRPDCLVGIAPVGPRLVCILDIERVLSMDAILAAQTLTTGSQAAEAVGPDVTRDPAPPRAEVETPGPAREPLSPKRGTGGRRQTRTRIR